MKKYLGYILFILMFASGTASLYTSAQFGDTTYVADVGVPGTQDGLKEDALIVSIKNFINWALGMLATIALVLCLYAGFLMLTSAGDEKKYSKGMDILKKAGIGMVIIGLSWLIVSLIFWLINNLV